MPTRKLKRVSAFAVYKDKGSSHKNEGQGLRDNGHPVSTLKTNAKIRAGKRKRKVKEVSRKKKRKIEVAPVECPDLKSLQTVSEDRQCLLNVEDYQIDISAEVEDIPFISLFKPDAYADSRESAAELFKLLIKPLSIEQFFSKIWEKRPLVLRRHKPLYNKGWFSSEELDSILRENYLEFSTNIDLTTYMDGERKTHNPVGRAMAATVWQHFKEGCSVRLLNPQTFSKTVWMLNSTLQELFNSGVGANIYLTPAGSQGFSPHYDDIEAFVMQLEGRKKWRLYQPRDIGECLPRFSSGNFTDTEIGEPMLEVVLEPGDLLYFPRGFIHQASTPPDTHSLHVTISTYQRNTWADLLGKLLPAALDVAAREDLEFRSGLPLDYLDYTGIVHSDSNDHRRNVFFKEISHFFSKLLKYAPIDATADQMGAKFIHDSLPPCTTEEESCALASAMGCKWEDGKLVEGVKLSGHTQVKLFRHGTVRLVMEKEATVLYSTVHNTRCPHERDLVGMELHDYEAPGVDYLINSYPNYVSVDSIPFEDGSIQNKIELCNSMYQQGLLVIKHHKTN